ncbi:DinB family protein [Paradesertivirga mongoliensis]|uniref:DinB family protein n=1 Tax=Paradesertivirga mongoliensis TaxID=2100740 RepID=A0ABW4ZKW4_9SPHI|nr:DinB family protein [Pedobacter mongoliensis]
MIADFIRYTEVADGIIIKIFLEAKRSLPEAETLFSHVLNAQHIWASRINGLKPSFLTWDLQPVSVFEEMHVSNIAQLKEILAKDDLGRTVSYTTQAGDSLVNTVGDIILHAANHSIYHRAQVVSLFKQNNIKPPVTDLIALKRQGLL